jgi:RNA polymerase sigma-70 factor (ECF subfamily)
MMPDFAGETARLLDLVRQGDNQARKDLISHVYERLRCLTSRMLKGYPGIQRWDQTDDVWQQASLRLWKALKGTQPESVRHFYNLAALQIRRELIDLARHYIGPQGRGANHQTNGAAKAADDPGGCLDGLQDDAGEPSSLEEWTAFHQHVEELPEQERELFGLLWYQELTQEEAATVLGVSLRTVKRWWQVAREKLAETLSDLPPG